VRAETSVVFPWSTCPTTPIFTLGMEISLTGSQTSLTTRTPAYLYLIRLLRRQFSSEIGIAGRDGGGRGHGLPRPAPSRALPRRGWSVGRCVPIDGSAIAGNRRGVPTRRGRSVSGAPESVSPARITSVNPTGIGDRDPLHGPRRGRRPRQEREKPYPGLEKGTIT
jgi:hypothetical protein